MKRILFILLLGIAVLALADCPGCIISGFVTDSTNGEAIAGANLHIEAEPYGAAANIHGYYTIPKIDRGGPYTLVISAIGYRTVKRQIVCSCNEHHRLDFELVPEAIKQEEVIIEADRVGGMQDPLAGHSIIKSDMVVKFPGLVEPDLFRSLQLMPGIQSISDFSSGLYIWGGAPGDNLILLDNIEVYNPTHLMGIFSTFIVDAVREVNLVKGGYPAKWGGRVGSVLDITNKDGNRKDVHGIAELSLLSGKALVEGPMNKGSWMIAGRRTWIDLATKAMANSGILQEGEDLPYYLYDIQGKINRDISDKDKISFSFYGGDDVLAFDEEEDEDFEYRWGNLTACARWTRIFSDKLFGHMIIAGSRFRTRLKDETDWDKMNLKDEIGDISLKGDFSYFYSDKHTFNMGGVIKWREFHNSFDYYEQDDFGGDEEYHQDDYTGASLVALYFEEDYNPNFNWNIQAGIRAEYATNGGYFRVSPRLSFQRRLNESLTLRGAYGRYYQYIHLVNPLQESGIAVFDSWLPVDENLEPAMADHFVLGMETDYLPVDITTNLFFKKMDNVLEPRNDFAIHMDDGTRVRAYVGEGWASGGEITFEGRIGKFSGWTGYCLSWTKRKMEGFNDDKYYSPKYDRRHSAKIAFNYDVSPRLILTAAFNYGTGQPITEPVDFEEETPGGSDIYYWPIYGDFHNGRMPDYARMDFGLEWVARKKKWELKPYFQIINILNRENVFMLEWDEPSINTTEPDEETMIPLIPTFGIRAEF